jgi:hypothetical protein
MGKRGLRRGAVPPHALRRREFYRYPTTPPAIAVNLGDTRISLHCPLLVCFIQMLLTDSTQACAAPKVFKKLA